MRVWFLLLAAATVLLQTSNALSTTADDDTVVVEPNQVHPVTTVQKNDNVKRFLRSHKSKKVRYDDDEERNLAELINRLMNSGSARDPDYYKLWKANWTARDVHNALNVDSNPAYSRIVHEFESYLEKMPRRSVD